MKLLPYEVEALASTPEALDMLADWHESHLTMAEAINDGGIYDESIKLHEQRQEAIRHEAARLRSRGMSDHRSNATKQRRCGCVRYWCWRCAGKWGNRK